MKYKIRINYIHLQDNLMFIGWSAKGVGFGVLTVHREEKENYESFEVETECMGKSFYKQVLEEATKYLVENSKIIE